MKKKLLLVLMLIAAVVVMPRVYAADAITLGDVEDITNPDTLISEEGKTTHSIDKSDLSKVTITYDAAKFKLLDDGEDEDVEDRPAGYAWIGFRVKNATGAKKYSVTFNGKETEIKDKEVSGSSFDDYIGFKVADLEAATKAGKKIEYTYEITWATEDKATTITQTITVVVNPASITLVDPEKGVEGTEESEEVWNNNSYEETRPAKVIVKVMKDGEEVTLDTPLSYNLVDTTKLTDEQVAAIKAALTGENLELVGLYTDAEQKTAFDTTKEITDDVVVYVVYKTKAEEPAPNTVDNGIMYIALAGASLLIAGGVAVYFKKVNE